MASPSGLVWQSPPIVLSQRIVDYGREVRAALSALMGYFAAQIEAAMKAGARWTDQTGAARAGLRATVEETATSLTLVAAHSVFYGIYLELSNAGRYAIIGPTLETFYGRVAAGLRALVGA